MTIWMYFIVGIMLAIEVVLFEINLTEKEPIKSLIGAAVFYVLLWPLSLLLSIALAIYCRIDPQHRFLFDIVDKD